jgi:hypothetical protein
MPVSPLFSVPQSDLDVSSWGFIHMTHHRDMIATVRRGYGVVLTEYSLYPVDLKNPGGWALYHQSMHADLDAVLGTQAFGGFDIEAMDFTDPVQARTWIWNHATMHYQEAQASNTW